MHLHQRFEPPLFSPPRRGRCKRGLVTELRKGLIQNFQRLVDLIFSYVQWRRDADHVAHKPTFADEQAVFFGRLEEPPLNVTKDQIDQALKVRSEEHTSEL